MAYRHVGPCKVLIGDPTTALGADMVELMDIEDVRINANIRTSFGSSAALAGAPISTALYRMPPQPAIQATIHDADLDILAELILGISTVTTGGHKTLGIGDAFEKIEGPTLCVIPEAQKGDGIGAVNGFWLPGCIVQGLSDLVYNRPVPEEIQNPYSVEFMGVYTAVDQDDTAIPVNNRLAFWGPPNGLSAASIGWSLPAL